MQLFPDNSAIPSCTRAPLAAQECASFRSACRQYPPLGPPADLIVAISSEPILTGPAKFRARPPHRTFDALVDIEEAAPSPHTSISSPAAGHQFCDNCGWCLLTTACPSPLRPKYIVVARDVRLPNIRGSCIPRYGSLKRKSGDHPVKVNEASTINNKLGKELRHAKG